jgi:hypothetical protein
MPLARWLAGLSAPRCDTLHISILPIEPRIGSIRSTACVGVLDGSLPPYALSHLVRLISVNDPR